MLDFNTISRCKTEARVMEQIVAMKEACNQNSIGDIALFDLFPVSLIFFPRLFKI